MSYLNFIETSFHEDRQFRETKFKSLEPTNFPDNQQFMQHKQLDHGEQLNQREISREEFNNEKDINEQDYKSEEQGPDL